MKVVQRSGVRRPACRLLACSALAMAFAPTAGAAPAPSSPAPPAVRLGPTVEITTAPRIAGLRFSLGGRIFVTDERGTIAIPADAVAAGPSETQAQSMLRRLRLLRTPREGGVEYRISRYTAFSSGRGRLIVRATMDTFVPVRFGFTDRSGRPIDPGRLDSMTIKRSDGAVVSLGRKQLSGPVTVQASRVVRLGGRFHSKDLAFRIQSVLIGGNNVVNEAQQAFTPLRTRDVGVELLFYSLRVSARDRIFGYGIGSGIELQYPDGRVERHGFADGHEVLLPSLPRGQYQLGVDASGLSSSQPVVITRDQVVEIKVVSYVDIAFLLGLVVTLAVGLLLVGRGPVGGFGRSASRRRLISRDAGPERHVDGV